MKLLDQLALAARTTRRRAAGRLGLSPRPSSVCLRLDDFDAPVVIPPGLDLPGWEERIIGLVLALGPLPTRVVAAADHPLLPDVARFVGRLECPVTIRTGVAHLDVPRARELVDAGLRRVEVVVPDGVALDGAEVALPAVAALAAARALRPMRFEIVVELPAGAAAAGVDPAALTAPLRAAGADGVRVGVPWSGPAPTGPGLEAMRRWHASFHRTPRTTFAALARYDAAGPGAPRVHGRCPVGTQRVELAADGSACACPFKPGRVALGPDAALDGLAAQRVEIAACRRECFHPDLA